MLGSEEKDAASPGAESNGGDGGDDTTASQVRRRSTQVGPPVYAGASPEAS